MLFKHLCEEYFEKKCIPKEQSVPVYFCMFPQHFKITYGIQEKKLYLLYKNWLGTSHEWNTSQDIDEWIYNTSIHYAYSTNVTKTVYEIKELLEQLAANKDTFNILFTNTSSIEHKWLCRIILKDIRCGYSLKKSLGNDKYNGFLYGYSIENVLNEKYKLNFKLFQPFHPMLCERSTINSIQNKNYNKMVYVQEKMDGWRIQIHIQKPNIKIFTRQQHDITNMFTNMFTNILQFINLNTCILDGEVVALNKYGNVDTHSVAQIRKNVSNKIFIYDYAILNKTFEERWNVLLKNTKNNSKIELLTTQYTHTMYVPRMMHIVKEEHKEGIVAKQPSSYYVVGARTKGWFKCKVMYNSELRDTVNLLLLKKFRKQNEWNYKLGIRDRFGKYILICIAKRGLSYENKLNLKERKSIIETTGVRFQKTQNEKYGLGYYLEFPRMLRIVDHLSTKDDVLDIIQPSKKRKRKSEYFYNEINRKMLKDLIDKYDNGFIQFNVDKLSEYELTKVDKYGRNIFMNACKRYYYLEYETFEKILETYLEKDISMDIQDKKGRSIIMYLLLYVDIDVLPDIIIGSVNEYHNNWWKSLQIKTKKGKTILDILHSRRCGAENTYKLIHFFEKVQLFA